MLARVVVVALVCAAVVVAQDPAQGWLAYATAHCPPGTRMTRFEADWNVLGNAPPSGAFYSPWIGSDTSDNLNLIQPVNPWFGDSWYIYTEYFQWQPTNNINSAQHSVNAGDQLHASLVYQTGQQSYTLTQSDVTNGKTSTMNIPVQKAADGSFKNYSIFYIVFEKVANCNEYPPNEKITFSNIVAECNNQRVTPRWSVSYVDDVCDFRAHIVDPSTVTITWNTNAANPTPEQFARSAKSRHLVPPRRNGPQ